MPTQRLEITWIGKNNPEYDIANIEPRILIEDPEKSHGDPTSENMLIHGDNLLALKALLPEYEGKIKCIYIDPPYNTGKAMEYYDDCVEHSIWLSLMRPRLELLKMLLANDGFICCQIDDSEGHYLKILMDEVFGRDNYQATMYVRVRYPDKTLTSDMDFHKEIEQINVFRKCYGAKPNLNESDSNFDKFIFEIQELNSGKRTELGGKNVEVFSKGDYKIIKKDVGSEYGLKEIWATGSILDGNSSGRFFRDYLMGKYENDGYGALYKVYGIGDDRYDYRYFTGPNKAGATKGKYFQGVPTSQLEDVGLKKTTPINNFYDLAGSFGNCRTEGGVGFRGGKKPEALLEIILRHFSNKGDIVLDSFLGSGTTAAVAHKMGRRWIGIEMGDHAYTHGKKRLDDIIDGRDQTGISKSVEWNGGGGYKFYELAPSFITIDEFGNRIIDEFYNDSKLVRAMCKLMNYTFKPSQTEYYKQGVGTGHNYLFVTTQTLSIGLVRQIVSHLGANESLVICPKKYEAGAESVDPRITIKKIPQSILKACQYGKKDYLLPIRESTLEEIEDEEEESN